MKALLKSVVILLCFIAFSGCSSTRLTRQYKNPESLDFHAQKLLVVGISQNSKLRRTYEQKMVDALQKEGVNAVKSIDFFEKSFTSSTQSLQQLDEIENKLLESDFDAILFTNITGRENRVTLVDAYRNFERNYKNFKDYYYWNQQFNSKEEEEDYVVYTTETSLYCICPGTERELLWRGEIEVIDAARINKNIKDYITSLFKTFKANRLLLVKD
ncbi:MAG: hypothetical protein WCD31_14670 [Gillisia sp.]